MHQLPGEIRTVQNGPATIAYAVCGPAGPTVPTICLVASTGRGPEDFAPLCTRLVAAGFRLVLPWPRGIGESKGPTDNVDFHELAGDVAAALEAESGSGGAFVAGHAYGCWIARTLCNDRPDLVDGLIMLAAGAPSWPSELSQAIATINSPTAQEDERLAALKLGFFADGNDARPWLDGWHREILDMQRAARTRTKKESWWASGHAPILDIVGLQDPFRPAEARLCYREEFGPRVTLKTVDGASHALPDERPDEVAALITEWINVRLGELH